MNLRGLVPVAVKRLCALCALPPVAPWMQRLDYDAAIHYFAQAADTEPGTAAACSLGIAVGNARIASHMASIVGSLPPIK